MRAAGAMIGVCGSTISHCEQGRMNFPPGRIPDLIRGYGFTQSDFEEFVMGRALPVLDIREECVQMIARLDATKLKPLHAVLLSFLNQ
jgi:hypothetical protein